MDFTRLENLFAYLYKRTNIGFVFWFLTGVLITVICYKPFEQPILFDRAYLLYMSQVVFRGEALYNTTTFGYTPLSAILVGFLMKLGSLLSLNTIESARITGLILYGTLSGTVFVMSKTLFNDKRTTFIACILFCGLCYLQVLSGVNAEPKLWVLLFSILGIYFFNKNNWFLVGLFFSFAAMCWHVAVVSLFASAIMLPWRSSRFFSSVLKLFLGVVAGTLPVLLYLLLTDGWLDFWNQAVIRKLVIEGEVVGESPFNWLIEGVYPFFILESLHFVFALLGFVFCIYQIFKHKTKIKDIIGNKETLLFLITYCILWGIFNSLDFQSDVDMLPLIPPVIIFSSYFLVRILNAIDNKKLRVLAYGFLGLYSFFDIFTYNLPYTFTEQMNTISLLKSKYDKVFPISFEEYYVLQEKRMPTKFMRYESYEDHLIERNGAGCFGVGQLINNGQFGSIIELDGNKGQKSDKLIDLLNVIPGGKSYYKPNYKRGKCATHLIDNYTSSKTEDTFSLKYQSILLGKSFYTYKYYSVFKIE